MIPPLDPPLKRISSYFDVIASEPTLTFILSTMNAFDKLRNAHEVRICATFIVPSWVPHDFDVKQSAGHINDWCIEKITRKGIRLHGGGCENKT